VLSVDDGGNLTFRPKEKEPRIAFCE